MKYEFYELSPDERKEWRESHVTKLAFKMLKGEMEMTLQNLISATNTSDERAVWSKAGAYAALQQSFALLERE